MELNFLGQGFEQVSNDSVGNHLIKYLSSNDFHTFTAYSAFTSVSGIKRLEGYINKPNSSFSSFNFVLGINQRGTTKEALEAVFKLNVNSHIFYHHPNFIFHPKIYLFEGVNISKIIIGSSNLTTNGLFMNIESSILVTIDPNKKNEVKFLNEIKEYYKTIFDKTDPNLKPISTKLIDELFKAGVIPSENERKAENSKKRGGNGPNKSILHIFPTRKTPKYPRSPAGVRRKVSPSKSRLKKITTKSYLYTEPSYHFPQGVHIGHILYALRIIKENALTNSHLDPKYVRLRGDFSSGDLGKFQRKTKYLLVALMEMGIIQDNRNLVKPSSYILAFTKVGLKLANILDPLLGVANLDFKFKSGTVPSWEMVANKKHYVSLVKVLMNSSTKNLLFWRDLILEMPAINIMIELLESSPNVDIQKSDFIYSSFPTFKANVAFCKKHSIKPGTVESAKHRGPFLLDLLEIGEYLDQKSSSVTLK